MLLYIFSGIIFVVWSSFSESGIYGYVIKAEGIQRFKRSPPNRTEHGEVRLTGNQHNLRLDTNSKLWESGRGHTLDGRGHYQLNFGETPKQEYGASLTFAKPEKYSITGSFNGEDAQKHLRADVGVDIWKSNNGRANLKTDAYYQKNWGEGPKHDYGAKLSLNYIF